MKRISVAISLLLLSTMVLFQNCGGESIVTRLPGNSVLGLAPHNYFTETKPASMCGEEGYNFLMDQYLIRNCGACHEDPPLVEPPFAASQNRAFAYFASSLVTRENWIETTTNNTFCAGDCNLDTRGEVYEGLVEWLDCR